MRILFDSKNEAFKTPFGTLHPFDECSVRIHIPKECGSINVRLIFERENAVHYSEYSLEKIGEHEEYEIFEARFAFAQTGLYFYYFNITTCDGAFPLFREGYNDTNMCTGEKWQLSVVPENFDVPDDFAGKFMYQIFPDRFNKSGKTDLSEKLQPFTVHSDLTDIPNFLPDINGEVLNNDFFGGNLKGIEQKLAYLKELGVSVIYLNPIFKAFSNHRYDTADYKKIDEMLGNENDFKSLCKKAHSLGMKIILDGVFSHTGSRSIYFDSENEFKNGAISAESSPYKSWYDFKHFPDDYTSWWGIKTLPCVNENDQSYQNYIFADDDSVIAHWLSLGADGFRLDVADELPDEFILKLRQRIKSVNPEALLIGEVWEDASNKISYGIRRRYFTSGELDSVMNYPFRNAILDFVSEKDNGENFYKTVMTVAENYPKKVLLCLMNMLSTHDTPRVLSLLGAQPLFTKAERAEQKLGAEQKEKAVKRLFCAAFLQFVLPGMPCVYYGDEIGMEGYEDPFCRGYFKWDEVKDNPICDFYKKLAAMRENTNALKFGNLNAFGGGGLVCVEREYDGKKVCALVNCSDEKEYNIGGKIIFSHNVKADGDKIILERFSVMLYEK